MYKKKVAVNNSGLSGLSSIFDLSNAKMKIWHAKS